MPIQLRPPASTSYLTTIPSSQVMSACCMVVGHVCVMNDQEIIFYQILFQVQSPRLVYTQSGGQPPHPGGRYYATANQRDL